MRTVSPSLTCLGVTVHVCAAAGSAQRAENMSAKSGPRRSARTPMERQPVIYSCELNWYSRGPRGDSQGQKVQKDRCAKGGRAHATNGIGLETGSDRLFFLCLVCFAISGSVVRLKAQSPAVELTGMWKAT